MWDKISALIGSVVALTRNVDVAQNNIAELQDEVKRLTERVSILAFELQRQRDEANHRQETAKRDQEILVLRLQLALKDAGRETAARAVKYLQHRGRERREQQHLEPYFQLGNFFCPDLVKNRTK